jgi:RNA polymerase sigma factor (sigma-70 family)
MIVSQVVAIRMVKPDLEILCGEAAAGSPEALTTLLLIHHARLLEHAVRKVGPDWRGKLDPEDLLQEAYTDVFTAVRSFAYRGPDSFYQWVAQIVDRRYVDQVRRWRARKRDVAREQRTAGAADTGGSAYQRMMERHFLDSHTPSRSVGTRESVGVLMCAIAKLPEDYRQVLRRVYLNDEPLAAVAAEMRRSEDAIRRLAGRALERLRHDVNGSPA